MPGKKKEKKEKKVKKKKGAEGGEPQEGKKSKKKLLLIPIALVLVAAIGAAAVLFILPRFGIDLLGGGEPGPGEEEPPKNLEVYSIGEEAEDEEGVSTLDSTISLDTLLEEGEGTLLAVRKNQTAKPAGNEEDGDASGSSSAAPEPQVEQNIYIYDVTSPAAVIDRYLDAVLGGEESFVIVDETYLPVEERPVLEDAVGALTLARPSVQEGHIFQLVIGWSEASSLAIRVSAPEGAIREPEVPDENNIGLGSQVTETVPLTEQLEKLKSMSPAQLGLEGDSMDDYEILPVEGFVKVDGFDCRRFNVYTKRASGQGTYPNLEGIIMLSTDQKHVYYMDPVSNAVTEMR